MLNAFKEDWMSKVILSLLQIMDTLLNQKKKHKNLGN